jgi:hypothetical protein
MDNAANTVQTAGSAQQANLANNAGNTVVAASDGEQLTLVANYDFTGGSLKDTIGGYDMVLKNNASIGTFGDRNNNEALNLKNGDSGNQYAELPSSLFQSVGDDTTIEFAAKSRQADSANYFSFTVGKDASKYLMFYVSTQSAKLAIADNGYHNEPGFKATLENNDNIWHNYRIVVKGDTLALFRDNAFVGMRSDTKIKLSDLGGTTAYIGKSFYGGDKYWNGAIDDIKIYKGAELKMPTAVSIAGDGVVGDKLAMIEGGSTQLTAGVTPADAISADVTWASSDTAVASVDENGKVSALKAGTATITATTKAGGLQAQLPVTVNPLDAQAAAQADVDGAISALKTTTTENLPLTATGAKYDSSIIWTSSDAKRITGTDPNYQSPKNGAADPYQGAGIVTRPAYGDGDAKPVTLTATATKGGAIATKTVDITVKEKTRTAPDTAYAAATFESDGSTGERIWMASTEKNDFFTFQTRNNGNAAIISNSDTKGLRDPYILRSHDGDKYYMVATDLKVSDMGWGDNQRIGSLKLEVWESTDLVNWTRTNAEDGDTGIKVNADTAGMTWAPEAFWDDDLNSYVVFFSTRVYTDDAHTKPVMGKKGRAYNEVHYVLTRDFKTYTNPPQDWQDTGYSRIDATVFKIGDYYYRLTKNEESKDAGSYIATGKSVFLERSKCLTCSTTEASPDNDPETGWQLLDENLLPFEGPESIALNPGDENQNDKGDAFIVMSDSHGYQPFMTSLSALESTNWNNRLSKSNNWGTQKAHGRNVTGRVFSTGMPDKTRHGAFVNIPETVSTALKTWSTVKAVDSKTTAQYDAKTRVAKVGVIAQDEGTVAGNAIFSAGDWSQTVKLASDGTASLTLPNSVAGDVTVAYDGYTDGLVNASNTTVSGVASGQTTPVVPPGDTGTGGNDGNTSDPTKPQHESQSDNAKIPSTGAAVGAIVVAVIVLAAAGIGLLIWHKRKS